jgi:hypothetical protein
MTLIVGIILAVALTADAAYTSDNSGHDTARIVIMTGAEPRPADVTWTVGFVQVNSFIPARSTINDALWSSAMAHKADFLPGREADGDWEIRIDVTGYHVTESLVSAGESQYLGSYSMMAHPITQYVAYNFDARTGKQLAIANLLNPAHYAGIKGAYSALLTILRRRAEFELGSECEITNEALLGPLTRAAGSIFFTAGGAEVAYGNYAFGSNPCSFGPTVIPYWQLRDILNPKYFPQELKS